jgi:hypothetical protein
MRIIASSLVALLGLTGLASAACPNAQTSVTIPLSGAAQVIVYDQGCNALAGPFTFANGLSSSYPVLNGTTSPSVVTGPGGVLQVSANAAVTGTSGTLHVTFTPSGTGQNITYTVGAPVTAMSFGTTTP